MDLQLPKGTRDIAPEEKIAKDKIVNTLKEVFELYGYAPLETPLLEKYDVLSSKYAGGNEILKETFRLKDQGDRELGLRYDLTVPMCRFVGMNPAMKMPFKRYQIGEVFRDGPVGSSRYRQFTQCDVDVVGSSSMSADAEIMALIYSAFKKLNLDVVIKVNNRKLLNDVLDYCGIEKNKQEAVILSIDKLEKMGIDVVKGELKKQDIDDKTIGKIIDILNIKGNNEEKIATAEAKVLQKLANINFPSPKLLKNDGKENLVIEKIDGKLVKDVLDKNYKKLAVEIGKKVAILHNNSIIHGDLTTSNMILNKEIYFIDFGLSFFSDKAEDKAVDLHLLKEALESKHYKIWEKCIKIALDAYRKEANMASETLKRLEVVEKRGRYRAKKGS